VDLLEDGLLVRLGLDVFPSAPSRYAGLRLVCAGTLDQSTLPTLPDKHAIVLYVWEKHEDGQICWTSGSTQHRRFLGTVIPECLLTYANV